MGISKRQLEDERGFEPSDSNVCPQCFEDKGLKEYIVQNAFAAGCDYCAGGKDGRPSIDFNSLMEYILDCIKLEWDDPVNCMGWDSGEGGYYGANLTDKYDLLNDECEIECNHQDLFDKIVGSIELEEWCKVDPYGARRDEILLTTWNHFTNLLKHEVRFVFLNYEKPETHSALIEETPRKLSTILESLASYIADLNMILSLPPNSVVCRARQSKPNRKLTTANDLGPPPANKSMKYSSRMSPAGIPMFYCAMDEETAIEEIRGIKGGRFTVAQWENLQKLTLIDLRRIPSLPSFFEKDKNHLRSKILFLRNFLKDFIKPIKKDGREHVEYVPTQVVTEFLRHYYFHKDAKVDGIVYPSSRREGGVCCVLFMNSNDCTQDNEDTSKTLSLRTDSINEVP